MQIRPVTKDDLGFVLETFLRSFRVASTHSEDVSNKTICGMLLGLMDRGWRCNVSEAEGYLSGWSVHANRNHLAWIYVRDMFRFANYKDHDVCGLLTEAAGIETSKRIVTPFLPNRVKKTWQFVHRPFLVLP